jgi:hypothetical protein
MVPFPSTGSRNSKNPRNLASFEEYKENPLIQAEKEAHIT